MTKEEAIKIVRENMHLSYDEGHIFEALKILVPELAESEDERIREELIGHCKDLIRMSQDDKVMLSVYEPWLTYLEKQKEQKESITTEWPNLSNCPKNCKKCLAKCFYRKEAYEEKKPVEWSEDEKIRKWILDGLDFYAHEIDAPEDHKKAITYLEKQKEQKPAESNTIKGGDFISDGKRVFLVLANVKERNFGETGSTFCEGLILGVDGCVYCDAYDFKMFKRATPDERAKFIHDLKVGVKLKEQPAEWSEEDRKMLFKIMDYLKVDRDEHPERTRINDMLSWLIKIPNRFYPQSKQEWDEEDTWKRKELIQYLEEKGDYRTVWMTWLKSLRPQPKQGWSEEEERHLYNAIEAVKYVYDISEGTNGFKCVKFLKSLRPQLHWRPSEEQMRAVFDASERNDGLGSVLRDFYNDLKRNFSL